MFRNKNLDGLWADGRQSRLALLRTEEAKAISDLKKAFEGEDDEEIKAEILKEIKETKAAFKKERKKSDSSLF